MPFLPAGSTGVIVNPGDFIELRYPTPDTWNTNITFQVQIGEGTDDVTVGTKLPDAQPDFFSFTDQFGRTNPTSGSFIAVFEKNTTYYSQAIQVSGIELRVPIRIAVSASGPKGVYPNSAEAAFSINDGPYIREQDQFVAITASTTNGSKTFTVTSGNVGQLSVGRYVDTPNITGEITNISGNNVTVVEPASATGNTSGNVYFTVQAGNTVRLRILTEDWYTTNTNVTLTISDEYWNETGTNGAVSDTWSITTRAQLQEVTSLFDGVFTDFIDQRDFDFGTYKTRTFPITGIDDDTIVEAESTGAIEISTDGVNWVQTINDLTLGDSITARTLIGLDYTTKTSGDLTIFAVPNKTLPGGFDNNPAGTYGADQGNGNFEVTQIVGTRNDDQQIWTEVDRYPDPITLSPIFTFSDDVEIDINQQGTGYTNNTVYTTTNLTTPSATGLTIRTLQADPAFGIAILEIVERGTGYQDLDQIRINGGNNNAVFILNQYRKVRVSTTTTLPNAEVDRLYYVDVPISGLGVEYPDGAYNDLEDPLAGDDGNPTLPIDTSAVDGEDVRIAAVVNQGGAEIRKNDTGGWSTSIFVENGDVLNLRFRSSTSYDQTLTSSIIFQGPPNGGPLGNPTLGPVFNVPPYVTDTITLTTRDPRIVPERFKSEFQVVENAGEFVVSPINLQGLDAPTTLSLVSATPFSNAGVSTNDVVYQTAVTVNNGTAYVGIEAGPPGTVVEMTYRIGLGATFVTEKFAVLTRKDEYTYDIKTGGQDTTLFLPNWADEVDFYVYGAGGGDGGDDQPNSIGGRGAPGNWVSGTLSSPAAFWEDPDNRRIQIIVGTAGEDGDSFANGAAGGAGGVGFATGGNGGSGAVNEFSGGGGGGGGASGVNQLVGDIFSPAVLQTLVVAGGGGSGGGAGGDTTIPEPSQNGNQNLGGGALEPIGTIISVGDDGENNPTKGGGGGGAGGGWGTGGTTTTDKFDEFGGRIGSIVSPSESEDLDATGGTGGGWYYDPTVFTNITSPLTNSENGFGPGEDGLVIVAWPPQDTIPDPFSFTPVGPVDPDTEVESEIVQITGITGTVSFDVITNGQSAAIRTAPDIATLLTTPWSIGAAVRNNYYIQLRITTGFLYNIGYSVTVTPGDGSEVVWVVTTGDPPDTSPSSFSFQDLFLQPINTLVESNQVTIGGINQVVNVTATNGAELRVGIEDPGNPGTYIFGAWRTSDPNDPNPATIENGQRLQLRLTTSPNYVSTVSTGVIVGTSNLVTWSVTTQAEPDLEPDTLAFVPLINQDPAVEVFSNLQVIQDISEDITVSIAPDPTTGAQALLEVNGVQLGVSSAVVSEFDVIRLYYTTSLIPGEQVVFQVTAGVNLPVPWSVTNSGNFGTTPDNFTFGVDSTDIPSQLVESTAIVVVNGITNPGGVPLFTDEGSGIELEVVPPGGSFTGNYQPYAGVGSAIQVIDGTAIRARLLSPLFPGFQRVGTVFIGDGEGTFTVFLETPPQEPILGQWYSSLNVILRNVLPGPVVEETKYATKFDGLPIGTMMPVFKNSVDPGVTGFGELDGSIVSRFPGFIYCDGQSLDPLEYPALFDVIGYTYGQFVGTPPRFRLPDLRNKKVVGTGPVDGNRQSSAILSPNFGPAKNTANRSAFVPGSHGGLWFIDTIASPSAQDIPQVEQPPTGQEPIDSQFFDIGSIRTSGYIDVQSTIEFITTGESRGDISLKEQRLFEVPTHVHELVTGIIDQGFKGRISWGGNGGRSNDLQTVNYNTDAQPQQPEYNTFINLWGYAVFDGIELDADDTVTTTSAGDAKWTKKVEEWEPSFCSGIVLVQGDGRDGEHITESWPDVNYRQTGLEVGSPFYNEINSFIDLDTAPPGGVAAGDVYKWVASIDAAERQIGVNQFRPINRLDHSHYLTRENVQGDPTKFSYGNVADGGVVQSGVPSTPIIEAQFNSGDLGLEVLPGRFTLDQNKQIIPTPSFSPQEKVGLITPYIWTRWLIKAY